ncbi:MAG TPA: efflux RND transporter periplasmic adaptor subunit [Gemmatimonadales bacterium]|nr:efflux RND transporter periplasmic adaptor subunit [Gemmatimonadales bacterium]
MSRLRIAPLLCVVQLALVVGCSGGAGGDVEKEVRADVQTVVGARTAVAGVGPFAVAVGVIGTVSPRPDRYATLGAPAPTRVMRIFVTAGQAVAAGAPLIEFDRGPFDAAAQSARAAVTVAQGARDRAGRLADAGILPRKDVDQAAADLAQAQAALVIAQRNEELATLHSPVDGVVTRMTAVLGEAVDATTGPLVAVADPAALDVVFNLAPADAGPVRAGMSVSVWPAAESHGPPLAVGTVDAVGATVDSATRAVAVRARVTRSSRQLKIGEEVYGRITVGTHAHAVSVPLEALVPEGETFKVFVVDRTGLAFGRPVTVGERTDSLAEITSGLTGGETVVTYGAYGVSDSAKIVPAKP